MEFKISNIEFHSNLNLENNMFSCFMSILLIQSLSLSFTPVPRWSPSLSSSLKSNPSLFSSSLTRNPIPPLHPHSVHSSFSKRKIPNLIHLITSHIYFLVSPFWVNWIWFFKGMILKLITVFSLLVGLFTK